MWGGSAILFVVVDVVYIVLNIAYTRWLKHVVLWDVLVVVASKRRAKLVQLRGMATVTQKIMHEYSKTLLDQLILIVVVCAILTYSLYTFEADTANHALVITVPFVIFSIFRDLYLVYVKSEGDRPGELPFQSRQLLGTVVMCIVVVAVLYESAILGSHPLSP